MKAGFLTELEYELKPDRDDIWILTEPLVYYTEYLRRELVVPVGFESDGASIPRIPIVYELFGNKVHREGILHDAMYRSDFRPMISWNMANEIFLEAMGSRNKSPLIKYPVYEGVCLCGFKYFRKLTMNASL